MTQAPVFPAGRYGRRREPQRARRWIVPVLLAPIVLAMLWLAFTLYHKYGDQEFTPTVKSYSDISNTSVTVTLLVHKPDGHAATCRVRARDRSGYEVGYAKVPVGTGTDVQVVYVLSTTGRTYVVDVLGCAAAS